MLSIHPQILAKSPFLQRPSGAKRGRSVTYTWRKAFTAEQWIVERINRHLGREDRPELVEGLNTDGDPVGLALIDGFEFGG